MNRILHAHQDRALLMAREALHDGASRVVLQLPTGAGKTILAAKMVENALSKGRRVIFVVPALSLVDQTVERFAEEGIVDVGVMQAVHPLTDHTQPVQVASVQTLMRRKLPAADLVIIDEIHIWFDFYATWMAMAGWEKVPFIGLSATPWTRGLGKYFTRLLIPTDMHELTRLGLLVPVRTFAPWSPDLSKVHTLAGDYREDELAEAMNKPQIVADVVETWKARGEGRGTLVFAVDRAHAQALQRQFNEAGIAAGYIDAYTKAKDREAIRQAFHAGTIRVVCNVGCLTTGVDWDVRCIVLARPTKSPMLYVQMIGRGLRTAEGKEDCIILDHSDTTQRLGFAADIRKDKLSDGKPRDTTDRPRGGVLPKKCPKCSYLKAPKVHVCPSCGFAPERQANVEVEEGRLTEVSQAKVRHDRHTKQLWYSMLLAIADRRGKSKGWVSHTFKAKFGVWPTNMSSLRAEPSHEVTNFVKYRAIAWVRANGGSSGEAMRHAG